MGVQLNPYLNFRDNSRDAMTFYKDVFGGDLEITTFAELGAPVDDDEKDLVMHSRLNAPNGLALMAADTPRHMEYQPGGGFSVSLMGDDDATLRGYWDKLSDGGNVSMPLEKAPWGDTFGMCVDKFGTPWMVNISGTAGA